MRTKEKTKQFKDILLRKRKKDESLFKYIMGVFHLWFGLLSSIIICIVCITGCIYAFKNQIIDLYNYEKVFTKNSPSTINIDEIQQHFENQNKEINTIFIPDSKNRNWIISYTAADSSYPTTIYFNPYLKQELGSRNDGLDNFFQTTLNLHRTLLLGDWGRQIVGASVVIFIILLFSGFILWIPKKLKHIKQGLTIKFNSKFSRLNYDLHRTLGVYSMVFLFTIATTGIYFTYPWVKNILISSMGGASIHEANAATNDDDNDFAKLMEDMLARQDEKTETTTAIPLSKILKETNKHLHYTGNIFITMPNNENPRYNITKINSENWLRALLPDEISFNKKGELKNKELFLDKPLYQQFTLLAKPIHTGEIIGIPGIILYFIISLIGFTLPITGFFIWWNRIKKQI